VRPRTTAAGVHPNKPPRRAAGRIAIRRGPFRVATAPADEDGRAAEREDVVLDGDVDAFGFVGATE
jgi:hypothetical protein